MRLTKAESAALERIHLGGIEALCANGHKTTCRTIDSLVRKGLLETLADCTRPDGTVRRGGLTEAGKRLARTLAELSLCHATGNFAGLTYLADRGPYAGQTLTVMERDYLLPDRWIVATEDRRTFGVDAKDLLAVLS